MYRYLKFDAVCFLQQSKTFDSQIESLLRELDAISELGGQPDVGRSSGKADPTVRAAIQREQINAQIAQIQAYKQAKEYAFSHMPEQYIDVLNAFFFTEGHIYTNAQAVAKCYGINYPKGIYKLRREALEEFTRIITERYL